MIEILIVLSPVSIFSVWVVVIGISLFFFLNIEQEVDSMETTSRVIIGIVFIVCDMTQVV
jgi:hypothetical protein